MANYDLLNQDKATCAECDGTGWVGDNGPGIKGNTEIDPCGCGLKKPLLDGTTRKVSDLTVAELYDLIIKAVKECKQQDAANAEKQYGELWLERKKELNPLF